VFCQPENQKTISEALFLVLESGPLGRDFVQSPIAFACPLCTLPYRRRHSLAVLVSAKISRSLVISMCCCGYASVQNGKTRRYLWVLRFVLFFCSFGFFSAQTELLLRASLLFGNGEKRFRSEPEKIS